MKKEIKTRRLILRPYRSSDYSSWAAGQVDAQGKKPSKAFFLKKMKAYHQARKADLLYKFGVFDKKTNQNLGGIDLSILVRLQIQSANLGYAIYPQYWRMGYAKEAALAAMKYGFKYLGLHRIEAATEKENRASIGVARSLGMHAEGLRRRFYFEDEKKKWVDNVIFAATPEDVGIQSKRPSIKLSWQDYL